MAKEQISQRTIQYEAYRNGSEYLGTTTVDLPEITLLAEDVTGGVLTVLSILRLWPNSMPCLLP